MNQEKIGSFLKTLRKEKNLTQEQIAEQFLVSNRTVSRWENGNNLPDLYLIIEIAEFYNIDIKELLNGERKSEKMDNEVKETVLMVADYSIEEKAKVTKRMHCMFFAGTVGFIAYMLINILNLENTSPFDAIADFCVGFAFGMVIMGTLLTSKYAEKMRALKCKLLYKPKTK